MSGENVEVVHAITAHWNAEERSFSHLREYCDPEIELESPLSSVVGEPYRGYSGMEGWVRDLEEHFAEWRISLDDVREVGNQVITIGTVNALGHASGVALQFRSATVFYFGSDHRVRRIRIYPDVGEALKAVGLEE